MSDQLRSPLVGRGDTIFAGNYDGQVYALKASTGKPVWSRQLGKSNPGQLVSNMVWANGMLFMTTLGSNVYRLLVMNADTGKILANLVDQPLPGYGAWVTVADGRVQVSTPNGYLYVFGL